MNIEQIDVSNFPTVKLYLRIEDVLSGNTVTDLISDNFYVYEKIGNTGEYLEKEIKKSCST